MNRDEIRCWLEYHSAVFSGLSEWLEKQNDPGLTMGAWSKVLSSLGFEEAKTATDELFAMDESRQPKGFSGHPRAILAICKGKRRESGASRFKEGEWVFDPQAGKRVWAFACQHCEDAKSGTVCIWTPQALKCYERDPANFNYFTAGHQTGDGWCTHHVVVRCCCERGVLGSAHIPHVYDPKVHRRKYIPAGERTTFLDSLVETNAPSLF